MNRVTDFINKYPAISIVLGFQFFRFLLLPFMGLMPQDAYYHFYGENLSLSYFDHPGMIGYILRGFTTVFGKHVFVLKLADFTITSATLIVFYNLGSLFLSKGRLNNALVLLSSTIFISILSLNSTPDVPLILFWALSVLFLAKAIFENKKAHWIYAGLAMGLAFNSKYTALLLQIGLLAFVLFSNKYRKLLLSPWLWLSLIISALVTFPVWYWNYQHEFASFLFQSSDRTESISITNIQPKYFFGALGHQIFLVLPVVLIAFFTLLYKHIKKALTQFKLPSEKTLFLMAFFLPTFLGFFLLTPVYWVKLNWMMPSYVTGFILVAMSLKLKHLKTHVYIAAAFHLLISLQVLFFVAPIKSDDTWIGWKELTVATENLQKKYPNSFIFSADNYKTTACMTFFTDQKIYAQNVIGKHALHFSYLGDDLSKLNGKDALFIDSDKRFKNEDKNGSYPAELNDYFAKVTELAPIIVEIPGKGARKFWIYHCENYTFK